MAELDLFAKLTDDQKREIICLTLSSLVSQTELPLDSPELAD